MCDTLFVRFSNMATNQATVIPPFPVTIGLRVVYITRYVIRIKKHLHNGIEIIDIESNRKEYESLHPYIAIAGLHVTSRWPSWWSRTKAILSSGNKNPFPCKFFGKKKFYFINHQHSRLVTWLQTKNSWWLLGHLFHILMEDKFMWHNFIIHITVFSWSKLIENQWHDTHDAIIIDINSLFSLSKPWYVGWSSCAIRDVLAFGVFNWISLLKLVGWPLDWYTGNWYTGVPGFFSFRVWYTGQFT